MSARDHQRATDARMSKAAQSPRSHLFGIAEACQSKVLVRGRYPHPICQPKGDRQRGISTTIYQSAQRNSRRSSACLATILSISSAPSPVSFSRLPVGAA